MRAEIDSTAGSRAMALPLRSRAVSLFARNTAVGVIPFSIDMALLWAFVAFAIMPLRPAAMVAFLIATAPHYVLCRMWVFTDSARAMASGYLYFTINALIGLVMTILVFTWLADGAGVDIVVARFTASVAAGITVFLLNAILNFESV